MYNFEQVVNDYTRITDTSNSLIDHICVGRYKVDYVKEVIVPQLAVSDRYPVYHVARKSF